MSNLHAAGMRSGALRGKPLSPKEVEVLTAVSMGYSDGQTAAMLSITPGTVRTHTSAIRVKLGASNTAHAVRLGFTEGYLRLTPDTLRRQAVRAA